MLLVLCIPLSLDIVQRFRRATSYRYKRDRDRDVRRQLSADARPFHFSGSSSNNADGDDPDGDPLPYHRQSLGERLYPRVHALQPVCCWLLPPSATTSMSLKLEPYDVTSKIEGWKVGTTLYDVKFDFGGMFIPRGFSLGLKWINV